MSSLNNVHVFTTGQAAKVCRVSPRTIVKWTDAGLMAYYRIPGSQDRRITREELVRFLKERGMPLDDFDAENNLGGEDQEFNKVIGRLDFILSKLMEYAKEAKANRLSKYNRQTLKHHAEDMEAAAKAIFAKLGFQEGTPQP